MSGQIFRRGSCPQGPDSTDGALRMRRSFLLSLLVAVPTLVHGQSILRDAGRDIRTSVGDILFVYSSPARADSRAWLEAGGVIAATGLISLADDDLDRWV